MWLVMWLARVRRDMVRLRAWRRQMRDAPWWYC